MAIGRISGPMLFSNLERQGIDLAFEANLLYLDVTNSNIGINTDTPDANLQVVGTTHLANIVIVGNTISSTTGKVDLGSNANLIIRGGGDGYILTTDGTGNLSWTTLSGLATQFGNIVLNENTIEILELNGNLNLAANGTGSVVTENNFYAPNIFVGNIAASGNITAPWFLGNIIGDYGRFDIAAVNSATIASTVISTALTKVENVHFYGNTVEGYNGSLYLSANTAADANAIVKFTGTKAIDIPAGGDADRPPNPNLGYIRFNSERGTLEWWNGVSWIQGQSFIEEQTITPDGVNDTFTLDSSPPSATSILVSINGTVQRANVAYTVTGDQITFSEIPLDSDIVDIRYLAATGLATTFVGGNLTGDIYISSNADSYSTDTGALTVDGGVGVNGNLFVGGNIVAASGNTSTSTDTGALVVIGGAGINGNLYITNTGDVSANIGAFQTWANATFGTTTYSNANAAAYIPIDPTIIGINSNVSNVQANLGSFQTWANLNFGSAVFGNSNVAAWITVDPTIQEFHLYANLTFNDFYTQLLGVDANINSLNTHVNTLDANVGTLYLGNISTQANVGTLYLGNISTQANLGELYNANITTQANLGELYNANITTQANLGTLYLGNISTQANLGELYNANITTQANVGTLFLGNTSTQANLGAFQLYANSKIGNNPNSNLVVISTTEAESVTTGALVVQGGVGIAGNLYVGGNLTVANVSYEYKEVITTTELVQGNLVAASGTISSSINTGALVVVGGVGISESLHILNTGDVSANIGLLHNANIAINANLGAYQNWANINITEQGSDVANITANLGAYQIYANANIGAFQEYANTKIGNNNNSNIVAVSTESSTSTTTGAIVVIGGVGIAGNLNVGNTIIASGNIVANSGNVSTDTTTGALVVVGGIGVSGNINVGENIFTSGNLYTAGNVTFGNNLVTNGNIVAASSDPSTSVTTGALVVAGGIGIAGNLSLGGRVFGDLIPAVDDIYDVGAPLFRWRDLYLSRDLEVDGTTTVGGDLIVSGTNSSDSIATNSLDVSGTLTATYLAGVITTAAQPNITQLGTITAGTWNADTLAIAHGGTGGTSISQALNNLLPSGESLGYVLTTGGPGTYYWAEGTGGGGGGGGTLSGIFVESSRTYYTATLGQTEFKTTGNFTPGTGQLRIYQNGVRQFNSEYTEIDGNTFTLSTACAANDVILAEIDGFNYLTVFASNVVFSPVGGIPTAANTVQLALTSVETRKVDRAGDEMTGPLIIANANVATSTSTGALQVQGGVGIAGNLYIGGSASTALVAVGNVNVSGNINTTANVYASRVFSAGANVLVPNSNVATQVSSLGVGTAASSTGGEIRATNDVIAYYSDDRLKTRLGNIEHALDKVKSLTGFHYHANELAQSLGYAPKPEVGVSAQEVQRVFPEIVVPAPIDENYLTVKYEKLIPVLIEAIKELSEEIDSIKRKINGS